MEFDATFLVAIISFIVFIFIMNKIFYAPVLKIMQDRQEFVEQNFKSAKQTRKETQKKADYREAELEKSRSEARSKIAEQAQKIKSEHSKKIVGYKEELFSNISKERDSLRQSAYEAKEVLKDNVVDIAKDISLKLFGDSISADLIDKSQIREEGQV